MTPSHVPNLEPIDLFRLPRNQLENVAKANGIDASLHTSVILEKLKATHPLVQARMPSAGPSRSRRTNFGRSLPTSRRPRADELVTPSPLDAPIVEDTYNPYEPASPTPEPQRSGPADPEEVSYATATIKLLYDHDKNLIDAINKLKERTAFVRSKTTHLRKTVLAQKGLRERLEHYIQYWKPVDTQWSGKDLYGDQPFRASLKGECVRVLNDDEESDAEEPLPPNTMPTLIRDSSGAFSSLAAHLAKYPNLQPGNLPKSPQPSTSSLLPAEAERTTDIGSPTTASVLSNQLTVAKDVPRRVTSPDNQTQQELPKDTAEAPVQHTLRVPEEIHNHNGKRPRSEASASEFQPPSPKRRNTEVTSLPGSPVAPHRKGGSRGRSDSSQEEVDRQSVATMLSQVVDDGDEYQGTSASFSASTSAPTATSILTPSDVHHPTSVIAVRGIPEMAVDEAEDVLAPLPAGKPAVTARKQRSVPVRSNKGKARAEDDIPIAKPASRSKRQKSLSAQPAMKRARRSSRSMSKGLN